MDIFAQMGFEFGYRNLFALPIKQVLQNEQR